MANDLVKKSNGLITAKYKLNHTEQRVLHAVICLMNTHDEDFKRYEIRVADLAATYGLDGSSGNIYKQLKQAAINLVTEPLTLEVPLANGKIQKIHLAWCTSVRYIEGEGSLFVDFHPDLKPYFFQLQNQFTEYPLKHIVRFKGSYTLRFYEFLKMEQFKGENKNAHHQQSLPGKSFYFQCTLEELRSRLCLAVNEYTKTNDLKRFVIEPALKEIQKQTDLEILATEYLKKGRAIHGVKIIAQPRPEVVEAPKTKATKKIKPLRVKFSGLELIKFQLLKTKHPTITENDIWDLAEKHKMEPFGVIMKMLSSDSDDFGLELTD